MSEHGRHLVYGLHAIEAVVQRAPERILELWMTPQRDDARARHLKERAEAAGVHVQPASAAGLVKLAGAAAHQGAVAAIRPLKTWDEDELLTSLDRCVAPPLLLIIDGVTDPHNLGACLRTADAAGVDAVVIPKDRSASVDGVVRKAAAGAADIVPVAAVTNLARTLDRLKERLVWAVGLDGEAPASLYESDLKGAVALIVGSEGGGMRRLTRERCDFLFKIPIRGYVESLNVSVAAGVALFEARRQRGI